MQKSRPLLAAVAALLVGCGGHHHHGSSVSPFQGAYQGTFTQTLPVAGLVHGTASLTVSSDGTLSGTATDDRYAGTGTVASGSKIAADGSVTLIVDYPSANPATTTTQIGTFASDGAGGLTGTLTEQEAGGASGPSFTYALSAHASS